MNSSCYRPVALPSVLSEVEKRMVNERLLEFFDQKGTLSTLQGGGRAKRATVDHLMSLETTVGKAQASRIHLLRLGKSIKFNMETRHPEGNRLSRKRRKNVH